MPLSPSETREALAKLGIFPKRALGQNFLVDGNIVRKSLDLAQVAAGDRVVEVGPGLGTLTRTLLESGAEVWAVERDAVLARYLTEEVAPLHPGRLHLAIDDEMPAVGVVGGIPQLLLHYGIAVRITGREKA